MTPVKTTTEKFVGVLVVGLLIKRTVDHARDVRAYRRRSRERARSVGSRAGFDRPVPGQWEWPPGFRPDGRCEQDRQHNEESPTTRGA